LRKQHVHIITHVRVRAPILEPSQDFVLVLRAGFDGQHSATAVRAARILPYLALLETRIHLSNDLLDRPILHLSENFREALSDG